MLLKRKVYKANFKKLNKQELDKLEKMNRIFEIAKRMNEKKVDNA
jgi:hypothetical protein